MTIQTLPPLSLYIHLPWCIKKCPYCDFNSHAFKNTFPEKEYINALIKDFNESLYFVQGREINTVFFGGGTPSLFSPESISYLMSELKKSFAFSNNLEMTLEANPATIEHHDFKSFRDAGINRISLGVQTFNDQRLKSLGRIHTSKDIEQAINTIHNATFDHFNIDIMHGLPNQTVNEAIEDLSRAIAANPDHLSWYQLTIEPNTAFYQNPPTLPNEDILHQINLQGAQVLEENQYKQYEVSAFSKEHARCRHNLNYWQFGDYIGIGAGSHSKITDFIRKKIMRVNKIKNPIFYLNPLKDIKIKTEVLSEENVPFEFMLNALRLRDGFDFDLFERTTFLSHQVILPILQNLALKKLLTIEKQANTSVCRLTDFGHRFLNDVTEYFL